MIVDFVARFGLGQDAGRGSQRADFVNASVTRTVDFDHSRRLRPKSIAWAKTSLSLSGCDGGTGGVIEALAKIRAVLVLPDPRRASEQVRVPTREPSRSRLAELDERGLATSLVKIRGRYRPATTTYEPFSESLLA